MTKKKRERDTPPKSVSPNAAEEDAEVAFQVTFTAAANTQVSLLSKMDERKHRKVVKTLALLGQNPRYPGLNSHKIESVKVPGGQEVWESYVENNTPGAYRIFWFYGPDSGLITVFAVTPHP